MGFAEWSKKNKPKGYVEEKPKTTFREAATGIRTAAKTPEQIRREQISRLADPERKLTPYQKEQAQDVTKELKGELKQKFFQLKRTPEDTQKMADIAALEAKTKKSTQFGLGLAKSFGGEAMQKQAERVIPEKAKQYLPRYVDTYKAARTQAPLAFGAGQLTGEALQYAGAAKALAAIPQFGAAMKSGSAAQRIAAASIAGAPVDVASAALYASGDTEQFGKRLAENIGLGVAGGAAIEGAGKGIRSLRRADVQPPARKPAGQPIADGLRQAVPAPVTARTIEEIIPSRQTIIDHPEPYPFIPKGEMPRREVDVPSVTDAGKTRRFARTAIEAENIPDAISGALEREVQSGTFVYEPIRNIDSMAYAQKTVKEKGFDGAIVEWDNVSSGRKIATKDDIVLGEYLLNQAANAGDTKTAIKLAAEIAAEGTRAGQNVQALRLLKRMTPDGQLYYLQKTVQNLNNDLLEKLKQKAPNVTIDPVLADELLRATNQREVDVSVEKITQNIADQVPPNWVDKWNAWRYLSMLGNPKTHVRNVFGSAIFTPAIRIKDIIGSGIERAIPKAERTKAILTPKDSALRKFAQSDFANVKEQITAGGKLNPEDAIKAKRKIFDSKVLEKLRTLNMGALEVEDLAFLKMHYSSSFAQAMKSRGYTNEFLTNGTKEANKALEALRNYAINEAQKATFRDASAIANALNKFKKTGKIGAVIGEGLFPFTKTPVNILKRGLEYSPAGIVKGIKEALVDVKNGSKTAAEAIDSMSSGLTGTGIVALGAWLASIGIISGGASDNPEETMAKKLQGIQNYSLAIGDKTYTIDWTAPAALPLFVGVEIEKTFSGEDPNVSVATIVDNLTKVSEPMINMSMLQGLNRMFKSIAYGDAPLTGALAETASGYLGQAVPTVFGQVARTIDPTRRATFVEREGALPPFAQKFIQKQQAKIPFLSKSLTPYIDAWGREQKTESAALRAFQNFVSPGYLSDVKTTKVDSEVKRLHNKLGDKSVLPQYTDKYIKYEGQTKNLNSDEYYKYSKERGQKSFSYINDLVDTDSYKNLSDEKKAEAIADAYQYANAVSKEGVSDYKLDESMQKVKDLELKGVKPGYFFAVKGAQSGIESDKDSEGNTIEGSEKKKKIAAINNSTKGIDESKRYEIYQALGVGLSEKQLEKFKPLESKGMSKQDYFRYSNAISTAKGIKDNRTGKTVSGSLKNAQYKSLINAGMSPSQARYFMTVTIGSKW